ncbi:hypothetical protein RJ55_00652 [Drechmeria coniospora]|nr:hypothetical protein RJ55_00652 [Drechmeria coniospora]
MEVGEQHIQQIMDVRPGTKLFRTKLGYLQRVFTKKSFQVLLRAGIDTIVIVGQAPDIVEAVRQHNRDNIAKLASQIRVYTVPENKDLDKNAEGFAEAFAEIAQEGGNGFLITQKHGNKGTGSMTVMAWLHDKLLQGQNPTVLPADIAIKGMIPFKQALALVDYILGPKKKPTSRIQFTDSKELNTVQPYDRVQKAHIGQEPIVEVQDYVKNTARVAKQTSQAFQGGNRILVTQILGNEATSMVTGLVQIDDQALQGKPAINNAEKLAEIHMVRNPDVAKFLVQFEKMVRDPDPAWASLEDTFHDAPRPQTPPPDVPGPSGHDGAGPPRRAGTPSAGHEGAGRTGNDGAGRARANNDGNLETIEHDLSSTFEMMWGDVRPQNSHPRIGSGTGNTGNEVARPAPDDGAGGVLSNNDGAPEATEHQETTEVTETGAHSTVNKQGQKAGNRYDSHRSNSPSRGTPKHH